MHPTAGTLPVVIMQRLGAAGDAGRYTASVPRKVAWVNQYELETLWVKGSLTDVAYSFGNKVRLKTGERAGEVGKIVALLTVEPQPDYVIEYADGRSKRAVESDIEPAV